MRLPPFASKLLYSFAALNLVAGSAVFGQTTNTFTGSTNGTSQWTNTAVWSGGTVPNASDSSAIFTNTATNSGVVWAATNITLGSLRASNTSGNVVIGDNNITTDQLTLSTSSGIPVLSANTGGTVFMYATLAGTQGFTKSGGGVLTFRFNNTDHSYTGNVSIEAGQLAFQRDGTFGNAANDIIFTGSSVLMNASTVTGGAVTLNSGRTITINSGVTATFQNNASTNSTTIDGVVAGSGQLTVAGGNGSYTFNGANTHTGNTVVTNSAKMTLGAGGALSTNNLTVGGSSGAVLNLGGTAQAVRNLSLSTTNAGTQFITNGSLTVQGPVDQSFGATVNGSVANLAGLTAFTYSASTNAFGASATGANVTNTLHFASGTNTITAANIRLGGGGSNVAGQMTTVKLGGQNSWNADTDVFLGNFQGSASVSFSSGLTNSLLTVRGLAGGSSAVPVFRVGNTSSGNQATTGTLDLTGGSIDLIGTEVSVGYHTPGANTAATGTLTMPDGSVVATTLNIAGKSASTGTPTVTGTMNQSGGTVVADNVYLGAHLGSTAANFIANYNLTGGTLFAAAIGGQGSIFGSNTVRNLNLNGGELQNKAGGNLVISGVDSTAQGRLNVVIGASGSTIEADAARNVTLEANALISGSGALTKTGSGTLTINSAGTHTGTTTINGGSIVLGSGASISTNNLTFSGTSGGTLDLGGNSRSIARLVTSVSNNAATITATNGSLTINGTTTAAQTFGATVNGSGTDLGGLSDFTFTSSNAAFQVTATGANVTNTVQFSKNGISSITATSVIVGQGGSAVAGQMSVFRLGQSNVVNSSSLDIGTYQGSGTVNFNDGISNAVLTLRGESGGSSALGALRIGHANSGGIASVGTLNLTNGSIDAIASEVAVGYHNANASGSSSTGTLSMPGGTITAGTFSVAAKSATTGSPAIAGTINQSGGTVTATNLYLGNSAAPGGSDLPTMTANYNLTGGTLYAQTIGGNGANYGASSVRNLTINGGTVRNISGEDLTVNGLADTTAGRINLVVTNTGATFNADSGRNITVGSATRITGGGTLTKAGNGTLTIQSAETSLGTLKADVGSVVVDVGPGTFTVTNRLQLLPGNSVTGTLELKSGTNNFTSAATAALADNSAIGTAVMNVTGATANFSAARFLLGNKGTGVVSVSAGSLNLNAAGDLVIGGDIQFAANGANGTLTVSGGGAVNVSGAGNIILGHNATNGSTTNAAGTVNLDGGTFSTARSFSKGSAGTSSATINYNGGILRAATNSVTIGAGITNNILGGGAIIDTASNSVVYASVLGGTGNLIKQNAGTLTLATNNTYSGATTVEAGTLVVNGSLASSGVTVESGGTLGGSGSLGLTTIEAGGTISPGNSPGTLTLTNGLDWNGGGHYNWQIFDATGTAGTSWDLIDVTGGSWDINGLSSENPFNINLWSLSATNPDSSGVAVNFNAAQTYSWKILAATNISGTFNTNLFTINTGAFNGTAGFAGASGLFSLALDGNNDLFLNYAPGAEPIPEPGTWAAAALLVAAGYARWRRRSGSASRSRE